MKNGTRRGIAIAFFLSFWGIASGDSDIVAAVSPHTTADSVHTMPQEFNVAERKDVALDVLELIRFQNRSIEIHEPDATFLKLHFSRFNIPNGMTVEVRSPDGSESYRYTRSGGDARTLNRKAGDDGRSGFSAMSISGDTAIVEVFGKLEQVNSLKNRVYIDYYMSGYPEKLLATGSNGTAAQKSTVEASGKGGAKTQSVCGIDQRVPAACWEQSDPAEFDRSWPVARLLIGGGKSCTAWRVGPGNVLFTNHHCIANQQELETTEVWFNYQNITCGSSALEAIVKVAANTLFTTHQVLDFTLFSVQDFSLIEPFGYLGLDVRDAQLGEQIYIPQHGYGYPKQIAIESDMNASGLCEVDDLHVDKYAPDTDIGYFCDTVGGSSGSPVLAGSSGRAIALHHFGGCVNSGVKMSLIWPEISSFFGGQVPAGDDESGSENLPPVAQFGFACDGTLCSFDAGASADADGTISEYTWSFGDGSVGAGVTVEHDYAEAGSYSVMLTVVDNLEASDNLAQTVSVEPANQPPVATFQVTCDDLVCSFNATASSDADGSITSYGWSFGDGTDGTFGVPAVSHAYSAAGQYPVQLQVTDDDGATATADTLLTVSEPVVENQAPQASFTFSCQELACTFNAGASADADGSIVSYQWEFGGGFAGTGVTAEHDYAEAGSYSVMLTVVDDLGASNSLAQNVSVELANQPPVAAFQVSCDGLVCTLNASDSADADGSVASYGWVFGDGTSRTYGVPAVNHTYPAAGQYPVQLQVTDDDGATTTAEILLTVSELVVENQAPQASFTFSCQELACDFDAGGSTDPDGTIVSYHWDFGDGATGSGDRLSHAFAADGTYEVHLTVSDEREASSSATRTVQVVTTVAPVISLNAVSGKYRKNNWVDLEWSGAAGSIVDVYRKGSLLATTNNDGSYRDSNVSKRDKGLGYRVCEHDTSTCSDEVSP